MYHFFITAIIILKFGKGNIWPGKNFVVVDLEYEKINTSNSQHLLIIYYLLGPMLSILHIVSFLY